MKRRLILRRILLLFITVLLLIVILNFKLVSYGLGQLRGQLNIVWNARPVTEVLVDEKVDSLTKSRLLFIQQVRTFAVDSLGLKDSKNYTTLFDQHNKPILWVLTASERYRIKAYQWNFPFLGSVPYKGFFEYDKGSAEEKELIAKGYDTDYDYVSAWSTLGWFKDPILSNMLKRSEGQLAELIIHELLHSTVYIKGNTDFNENLASFVGEQGALVFLKSAYGDSSSQYIDYVNRKSDYDIFSQYLVAQTNELKNMYAALADQTDEVKEKARNAVFEKIVQRLDSLPFHQPERYKGIFEKRKMNNAYLMNFIRYDAQKDSLLSVLEKNFNGDIKNYIDALKKAN